MLPGDVCIACPVLTDKGLLEWCRALLLEAGLQHGGALSLLCTYGVLGVFNTFSRSHFERRTKSSLICHQ